MQTTAPRHAKIVVTLGPATDGIERELVRAGMDVARLNFSHGTPEEHARRCDAVRAAARALGRWVAVMQDLPGPKIRAGALISGGPVSLAENQIVSVVPGDGLGTAERIFTTYRHLVDDVKPGDPIWLDDGHIRLRVVEVTRGAVSARVEVGGLLGEHKGINLPGVALSAPSLTETDHESLRFGLERLGADYVALSFVRGAEDVVAAQRFVRESGARTPLIAKIEKPEAIENIEEIMDVADGVMVARGDLGIELGPENVPVAQKSIVQRANSHGKPVIVATQMLESMTREEIPTRAEASDVANAVWDGADAVMLSGETAVGRHPVLVVETMGRIVRSAESALRGKGYFLRRAREGRGRSYSAAITDAACILANDLHAKAIVGITQTGLTAHLLSGRRPHAPILAFSPDARVCQRLALWWGVTPVHLERRPDLETSIEAMESHLVSSGAAAPGDPIVVTGAHPMKPGLHTNFVKYQRVREKRPGDNSSSGSGKPLEDVDLDSSGRTEQNSA